MYPIYNTYPTVPNQLLPQPQTAQTIQYVSGRAGVDSFPMSANSSGLFMDSTQCKFYIKQTDANGIPTVKTYKFEEVTDDTVNAEYITRSEFENFKAELNKNSTGELSL